MPNKLKLAIFDLDGTLIHFHHDYLFSQTDKILKKLNHDQVPKDVLEKHFSDFDFFSFTNEGCKKTFEEKYWSHFDWENFPKDIVFDGVFELLEDLKRREIKLGLATARLCSLEQLKKDVSHTELLPLFDFIATREDEKIHWQDKTSQITSVCKELGVNPRDSFMAGDIPSDIRSAKKVDVRLSAAVLSGGIREDVLEKEEPDYIFPSISSMLTIF